VLTIKEWLIIQTSDTYRRHSSYVDPMPSYADAL